MHAQNSGVRAKADEATEMSQGVSGWIKTVSGDSRVIKERSPTVEVSKTRQGHRGNTVEEHPPTQTPRSRSLGDVMVGQLKRWSRMSPGHVRIMYKDKQDRGWSQYTVWVFAPELEGQWVDTHGNPCGTGDESPCYPENIMKVVMAVRILIGLLVWFIHFLGTLGS